VEAMAPPRLSPEAGRRKSGLRVLRHSRRALRLELTRVSKWRRLIRARVDIAIASAALPEPLGQDVLPYLTCDAQDDLPMYRELDAAVRGGLSSGEIDRIDTLRELDDRLARYEALVTGALSEATEDFITKLSRHPSDALDVTDLWNVP
jgi:hypothetical protein